MMLIVTLKRSPVRASLGLQHATRIISLPKMENVFHARPTGISWQKDLVFATGHLAMQTQHVAHLRCRQTRVLIIINYTNFRLASHAQRTNF
jgi:hypothetical protein